MKFIKSFTGATGGKPYPMNFNAGDECPDDLIDAAIELGAVELGKEKRENVPPSIETAEKGKREKA